MVPDPQQLPNGPPGRARRQAKSPRDRSPESQYARAHGTRWGRRYAGQSMTGLRWGIVSIANGLKRVVLGRALRSERLSQTLLPKRIALPVFASDALSSNAYATQEILLVLSLGGASLFACGPWIAGCVVLVYFLVIASYRQNVRAYPDGGGDYDVVSVNLGPQWGAFVGSALLIDYVLTVAVSVSAAVANLGSTIGFVGQHAVCFAVGFDQDCSG